MKLTAILYLSFSFAVSAFGVSSDPAFSKKAAVIKPTTFRKDQALGSPLFRDPSVVRGGAVPGWAAYNRALDDKPLITKAFTSLVGWALGDLLAQVGLVDVLLWLSCPFWCLSHGHSCHVRFLNLFCFCFCLLRRSSSVQDLSTCSVS